MKKIMCAFAVLGVLVACNKNVNVEPTSVSLNKHDLYLIEGETATLTATIAPDNASNKSINWTSTVTAVATVDQNGKVTAVAEGHGIIMVATVSGGKTDACNVHVSKKTPGPDPGEVVQSVTVSPATIEVTEGATAQLGASASPATASQEMEWASQDTKIVTVDASGLITGVSAGTTKVYARSKAYPEKQGFCEVTVIQDSSLKGISFSVSEVSLTVGQTYTLTVNYIPTYAANKNVSWTSGNSDVATVSAQGVVKALSEGAAVITATSEEGGYTATCMVVVKKDGSGGPYVYNVHGDIDKLWVNGELDPRTGAYNDDYQFFKYVDCIYSYGTDLYSAETYSDYAYKAQIYICKNRKPLYALPEESAHDTVIGLTARDETVAVVLWKQDDRSLYAIRFTPDGASTKCEIEGQFSSSIQLHSALAPNGDLHMASQMQDAFSDYYLTTFVFSADGSSLTETKIKEDNIMGNTKALIDISDEGDVYIFNSERVGDSIRAVLYKNGEVVSTFSDAEHYPLVALKAAYGHIYTAVLDYPTGTVVERCDETVIRTFQVGEGEEFYETLEHPLQVCSNGDIYLATKHYIFKNDQVIYTVPDDDIYMFCVTD